MKKKLFVVITLVLFSRVGLAKLAKVSKIYVTNGTFTEWDRGPVYKYTGEKYGLWLTSRWGKKRSWPGYICKSTIIPKRSCIYKKRMIRRSSKSEVTSKKMPVYPMNDKRFKKNVEILEISRDQSKASLANIQKEHGKKFTNPDPKQFKVPNFQWLYPFERIVTTLVAKDGSGKITLDLTSERVGQHVDAYQASLEGDIAGYTGDKELAEAAALAEFGSLGKEFMGPITALNPTFILGGGAFNVSDLVAQIQSFTTMAKRSGLVVKPYVQGNYTVQIKHGKPKGSPGHWDDDNVYIVIEKLRP